jgi:hypothetical protein
VFAAATATLVTGSGCRSRMVLVGESGDVRIFPKDAESAAAEACDWAWSEGSPFSAARLAEHSAGHLLAAGGKDTLLRVWDINASGATPVFTARRQHSDWLNRSVPVWVSDLCFLGVREATPEGSRPPLTAEALTQRYESDTDESGDEDVKRAKVSRLVAATLSTITGEETPIAAASSSLSSSSSSSKNKKKKAAARWSSVPSSRGREPVTLSDASDSEDDSEDGSEPPAIPLEAAIEQGIEGMDLEPWTIDESFVDPPSAALRDLTDEELHDQFVRRAVARAPFTRLPAKDTDWMPTPNAPSSVILTVSRHRYVSVYDTRARRQAVMFAEKVDDWALTACAVDPLSYSAFVGSSVGSVTRLELRKNLVPLRRYHGHSGAIRKIDVHPSMPLVATAGLDRCLRVFHADTGQLVRRVYLRQRLEDVLFSSEGRVKRPDLSRENDAQTDRLGLVVRISSLKGHWRDAVEGQRFRKGDGLDMALEDDGVTDADLEEAGVGPGARDLDRKATAEDEDWEELDRREREVSEESESAGSDFDDELDESEDDYDHMASKRGRDDDAGASAGKRQRAQAAADDDDDDDEDDSFGEEDDDDLLEDEEDGDDRRNGDDEDDEEEDGDDDPHGAESEDDAMALVDDRKALKAARKEAMKGKKRAEKQARRMEIQKRTAERGGSSKKRR